jgi:general secretion pathway protein G
VLRRVVRASGWGAAARRRRVGEQGFTLIELLAVVAIIGILTAFIIPRISAAVSDSAAQSAVNAVQGVATALESYYDQNGCFPGGGTCPAVSTYSDMEATLSPYGANLPSAASGANFWLAYSDTPSNSNAEALNYASSGVAYTLVVYAKNGEQSPIEVNVTAGSGGNIYVGAAAVNKSVTPSPPTAVQGCGGGGTTPCSFTYQTAVPW